MLWACELKTRSWWTGNLNLVRICVELLHTLSVWLTDTRCPHYFINNCNLLDNSFNVGSVANKLLSLDEEHLSNWFVNNYIGQCAQVCSVAVSRLFSDVSSIVKLQNVVSEIVRWRLNGNSLYDMWEAVEYAEDAIAEHVPRSSLTVRSCLCWMNELANVDQRFCIFFSAVELLHVACKLSRNSFNNLSHILSRLLGGNVFSLRKNELNTPELVELLQKSAVQCLTTYRQSVVRVLFCSHDCHNRLWGAVRVQTWRLSAVFTVVYTERTHAVAYSWHYACFDRGVSSVDGWWHCLTDCADADCQS